MFVDLGNEAETETHYCSVFKLVAIERGDKGPNHDCPHLISWFSLGRLLYLHAPMFPFMPALTVPRMYLFFRDHETNTI